MNPFPSTICLDIFTDKHWFTENVLCLLSNAVKYSTNGSVTVTITHGMSATKGLRSGSTLSESDGDSSCLCPASKGDAFTEVSGSHIISPATSTDNSIAQSSIPCHHSVQAFDSSVDDSKQLNPAEHLRKFSADTVSSSGSDSTSLSAQTIMIAIEDAGIGISEGEREDLFQPFKQVQRLAGGTGLGLYSLSNRIRALNGSRGVMSRSDGKLGSVFWFSIPYRPDPHAISERKVHLHHFEDRLIKTRKKGSSPRVKEDNDTSENAAVDVNGSLPREALRFLVVDDSSSILKVLGRALKSRKFNVVTADNGSAGLDRLMKGYATGEFDVVLMDLQMPVMDGIEAIRRYREFEAAQVRSQSDTTTPAPDEDPDSGLHSHSESDECKNGQVSPLSVSPFVSSPPTPKSKIKRQPLYVDGPFIIGMSANSDEDTKQCALSVGMDRFLAKPFTMADIFPLVEHLIPKQH